MFTAIFDSLYYNEAKKQYPNKLTIFFYNSYVFNYYCFNLFS
ncbi:hypothetical protein AP058_00790 [Flavobacterium sp. TAB 87]|nr:hypothetical protein AP058_00790 [Flavobacterium sp. TAB 87]